MSNVFSFDKFLQDRSASTTAEVRAYLKNFGISLAKYAVNAPQCQVKDSLCSVVAGWDLFINLDTLTDYWLPSALPVFKEQPNVIELRFLSGFGEPKNGRYPYGLEIDIEPITNGRPDLNVDCARVFENAVREHKPGVLVVSVLAIAIMKYATRDTMHGYRMHEVNDDSITMVIENPTERMTFRLDIDLTRKALQKLRTDCERLDRRDGFLPGERDWDIFEDQRLKDEE